MVDVALLISVGIESRRAPYPGQKYKHGWIPINPLQELKDAVSSGVSSARRLGGGRNSSTELVTHTNGTATIRKRLADATAEMGPGYTAGRQADAEQLVATLARAIDAPVPAVLKTDPDSVHIAVVPGESMADRITRVGKGLSFTGYDQYKAKLRQDLAATDAGLRLCVLDILTDSWDRANPANIMIDVHDQPWGIDNAFAFHHLDSADRPRGPFGPFAGQFITFQRHDRSTWSDNPLAPQDITWLRDRLNLVRADFAAAGREDWWQFASDRLDAIAAHATGTDPRLT